MNLISKGQRNDTNRKDVIEIGSKLKIMAALMLISVMVYLAGTVAVFVKTVSHWLDTGGINAGQPAMPALTPGPVLSALFVAPYNLWGLGAVVFLAALISAIFLKNNTVQGTLDTERNLIYSSRGAYGTAGWMTKDEQKQELELAGFLIRNRSTLICRMPIIRAGQWV